MIVRYGNLGQVDYCDRSVYIRSTDVEQMNWHRLLWSIPDEWLYQWHQDNTTVLIEETSNSRGKIAKIFHPVAIHVISKVLHLETAYPRGLERHVDRAEVEMSVDVGLRKKFKCWRGRINHVRLVVEERHLLKERNPIFGTKLQPVLIKQTS